MIKKFLAILALTFSLAGCPATVATLPSTPLLPDPPISLSVSKCPENLQGLSTTENVTLGDVLYVTSQNGKTYYQCKGQGDEWASWYADQQAKEKEQIKNEQHHIK